MNKKDLWLRLKNYQFEGIVPRGLMATVVQMFGGVDASAKAFAEKIARKRNWSTDYTLQAIEEYKKFVYLGMVSPANVTPPDPIDRVWHQHILFSKGYRDFCQNVLRHDFDHKPDLLKTNEEIEAFGGQYVETLALYEKEFGVTPPAHIWGAPKFRKVYPAKKPPVLSQNQRRVDSDESSTVDDIIPLYALFEDDLQRKVNIFPEFLPAPVAYDNSSPVKSDGKGGGYEEVLLESPGHSEPSNSHSHDSGGDHGGGHSDSGGHSCSSCSSSSCGGGGGD